MRRAIVVFAVLGSLGVAAAPAIAGVLAAPPTEISINDNFYDPATPPAQDFHSGASFHWQRSLTSTGNHDVVQDAKLFISGDPTTGPIDFTVNASAGTYHYYCSTHGVPGGSPMEGMNGIVKVRPVLLLDSLVGEIAVQWADSGTDTGSRFDVRYQVDGGKWKIWKDDTTKFQGNFGHNDRPVNYNPNRHTYKLESRSEKENVAKHSNWSPPVSLNP